MVSRTLFRAHEPRTDNVSVWMLGVLVAFSAIAIAGYWFFALNPQNLAKYPESAGFYAVSYRFFSQAQVWLSGLVLAVYLVRVSGLKWMVPLVVVYVLSLSSELLGTTTGFPFGDYAYTSFLGGQWFNHVPYVIPLSWFTMALPSFVLTGRLVGWKSNRYVRWVLTGWLLMVWDLALDPAMSFLVPYWEWGVSGIYYGMPFMNLVGWFVTGVVLAAALDATGLQDWQSKMSSRWLSTYYITLFSLPVGMLVAAGEWPAVVTSVGVLVATIEGFARWGIRSGSGQDAHDQHDVLKFSSTEPDEEELGVAIAAIASRSWRFFQQNSRSFSFASRMFSRRHRRVVSLLYAFCRVSDDLADRQDLNVAVRKRLLSHWRAVVSTSFHGSASGIDWLDELMTILRQADLPERVVMDLLDGIESDLGPVRIQHMDDLRTYTCRVASTVGIMMCHLFGEATPWKLARAAALGRAMQLTNIARDVGEDLDMDRIYIPLDMLDRHGISESDLRDMARTGVVLPAWRALMVEFQCFADAEYQKAWTAIPTLKPAFGRAVAVAASVYKGIHRELETAGYANLNDRAWTGPGRKMLLAVGGLGRYTWSRTGRNRGDALEASDTRVSPATGGHA